jgi:hypothetical protein
MNQKEIKKKFLAKEINTALKDNFNILSPGHSS